MDNMNDEMKPTLPKKPRGFAAMSKEAVQAIASKGGIAAHLPGGGAHRFTSEEARAAGRKGGLASYRRKLERAKAEGGGTPETPALPKDILA